MAEAGETPSTNRIERNVACTRLRRCTGCCFSCAICFCIQPQSSNNLGGKHSGPRGVLRAGALVDRVLRFNVNYCTNRRTLRQWIGGKVLFEKRVLPGPRRHKPSVTSAHSFPFYRMAIVFASLPPHQGNPRTDLSAAGLSDSP